jgi:hypothetical protein
MASYRRSILFRLASDPIAYLWSGFGNLYVEDDVDPAGATYLGGGSMLSVPALKQLINGVADRLEFTLSGVSAETLRLAQEDAATIRDALVLLGEQTFDENWQQVGTPDWVWRGFADCLFIDSEDSGGRRTRSIRLSVRSADIFRADPVLSYFTDQDQRRRSPDDAIFSHVSLISVGATRRFGPK